MKRSAIIILSGLTLAASVAMAGMYIARPAPSPLMYGSTGYSPTTYVLATEKNVQLVTEQNTNNAISLY